jgi:hypothetical protein
MYFGTLKACDFAISSMKRHTMASFSFSSESDDDQQQSHQQQNQQQSLDDNDDDNHSMSIETVQYDLSNLCLSKSSGTASSSRRSRRASVDGSSYSELAEFMMEYNMPRAQRRHSNVETSLYPNQEDLLASSLTECSVDDIFNKGAPPSHFPSNEPMQLRRFTSDPQLVNSTTISPMNESPPGAYSSTSNLCTNKTLNPSWVDKSMQVEQKIESQHRDPCDGSDDYDPPPLLEGDEEEEQHYKTSSSTGSPTKVGAFGVPTKYPPRPDVEISPGVYMTLRGTDETVRAIEAGRGKLVFCLACATPLQCVPDCDLVICPDCRVFSPVPKFDDDQHYVYGDDVDQQDCSGKTKDAKTKVAQPEWIGGVGLGLKVSFLD